MRSASALIGAVKTPSLGCNVAGVGSDGVGMVSGGVELVSPLLIRRETNFMRDALLKTEPDEVEEDDDDALVPPPPLACEICDTFRTALPLLELFMKSYQKGEEGKKGGGWFIRSLSHPEGKRGKKKSKIAKKKTLSVLSALCVV